MTCSIERLRSVLDGALSPRDEAVLCRHLEECAECAATLERLAGGDAASAETADMLAVDPWDADGPTRNIWSAVDFNAERFGPAAGPDVKGRFGDYDVLETIGRGGMGVVFKARHRELGRDVALKMILAGELASPTAIQRFHAEARAAAQLDHPGIVPLFDVGEQDGLHYFTMAFVAGPSLATVLHAGPLEEREAARLLCAAARAIDHAHQQGVIHRDLKPSNILLDAARQPKITDFGLAKRVGDASEMTGTGEILGTPSYMAPEQAWGQGDEIGPTTDVYGLGAVLFAVLTGRPPFQSASAWETMRHVVQEEPPNPRRLNPCVPRDLETICLKCLRKNPRQRYASAGAVADDLERYLNGQPIQGRPVGIVERVLRWYCRRPVVGTMAACLAVLLIAVPILLATLWQEADARADVEAAAHQKELKARQRIEALERERSRQLFEAYVNEAAARRASPRVGRRFESLARLVAARDLAVELNLPADDFVRLRSQAISALSLTDLRGSATGPGWTYRAGLFGYHGGSDCGCEWDRPSGLLIRRLSDNRVVQRIPDIKEDAGQYHDVPQISPDNRFVSLISKYRLTVWRIDGEKPESIVGRADVYAAAFVPDRPAVVLLTRKNELVVQPLDGKGAPKVLRSAEIEKEPQRKQHMQDLAASGRHVAVAGTDCVRLIDLDAGKMVADCELPSAVQCMDWSRDGATLAVACNDDSVTLFRPADESRRVLQGPLGGAMRVAFDPTGSHLLSSSVWTKRGILWDVARGAAELRFSPLELPIEGPQYAGSQRGGWWQGALDPAHRVIDSLIREPGDYHWNSSAAHPNGRLLATQTSKGIALGDLATGERLGLIPSGPGSTVRFDSAGNLYGFLDDWPHRWPVVAVDDRIKIGRPQRLDLLERNANFDLSASGRFIAQGLRSQTLVLDRDTGKTIRLVPQQDARLVAVSPDGSLIASFNWNARGFRLSDTATGKLVHAHNQGTVVWGRFTPDGKHLITRASGVPEIEMWSVPDGRLVRRLGAYGEFEISPDGRYLAAAEGVGKIRIHRIDTGERIARFDAPGNDYLADIRFSPDGRYLFGLNMDRTKHHVWDLWKLRRQLAELKLDWETTPAPAADAERAPLSVEIAEIVAQPRPKQP
jgi:eukaryotic-like serine/threonine-protein kinase